MRRFLPSTVSEVSRGGTANFRLRPHHQSILFGARQADQSGAGKEEEEEEEEEDRIVEMESSFRRRFASSPFLTMSDKRGSGTDKWVSRARARRSAQPNRTIDRLT